MKHSTADLRSYLDRIDAQGTLLRVSREVDVTEEVPALCSETDRPLLFSNLKDFDGFRLVDGLLNDRLHQGAVLNCPPEEVMSTYAQRCARGPGATVLLDDAPVKEVKWLGEQASLARLPVPIPSDGIAVPHLRLQPEDFASRVISGSIGITRDPDTGIQNCFFTMAKVDGNHRAHCYIFSPHTWANIRKYQERGERAPLALVIGCHPIYELGAVYTGPHEGFSELNLAAALLGETVALVKGETVDLELPAYSEIIIEGFIDPDLGPYVHTSAHTDTHCPFISREPFFDVTAITMRDQPIYRHIQPTRFTDHHAICEFITAPTLLSMLRGKGLDVHDVAVPLQSALNCAIVQMTPRVREEAREAALNGMALPFFPRLTIVVDEDVNIYDVNDVLYALSIRVDPLRDIMTVEGIRSFNLEPLGVPIPGMEDQLLRAGSRLGIDATRPPLSEPERRILFERLTARGAGRVQLKDYID